MLLPPDDIGSASQTSPVFLPKRLDEDVNEGQDTVMLDSSVDLFAGLKSAQAEALSRC
ncbi:hypothetical protein AcV5_008683 [Taiwanofungus camphoratus]|nr:hypothetical protein AcV5_008683 [Antrodia cinnamomea]